MDKYLLVTGGAGFIGSNFIRRLLLNSSYKVVNLDRLTYAGNLESLQDIQQNPNYAFVRGDVRVGSTVQFILNKYHPMSIVHFAAESHVDRSIVSAENFVSTNVMGTFTMLEEAKNYWLTLSSEEKKKFRFLHVSTDEVYGSLGDEGHFHEDSPMLPNSPYSASKAASDCLVRSYFMTYGLPTIITHSCNNYGPYQFPEKLIPLTILNALAGKDIPVYGDGSNVRDWIYVEDHCAALELLLTRGYVGEVYNIGASEEHTNIEVVEKICDILDIISPLSTGSHSKFITQVSDRPGHDYRYAIDESKIKYHLGWEPGLAFGSRLTQTVYWYLEHPEWIQHIQNGAYLEWINTNYAWRMPEN